MLSAERQILNLLYSYAERIDGGDLEGVADLFEHAVITAEGGREIRGRDAILGMFRPPGSPPPAAEPARRGGTKHVAANTILDINDEETRASSRTVYVVVIEREGGAMGIMTAGRYHDEFECVDGTWRFSARRYLQDL